MISGIMATYNSCRYITEQLESIRLQTVPIDEMIIIDDCSADETVQLLRKYIIEHKLSQWKLYCHDKNMGYIDTFTECLEKASGDIILLSDHDDVWESNKVEMIVKAFTKKKDILCLATSFNEIDENGNKIFVKLNPRKSNNNLIRRKVTFKELNKMSIRDIGVYNIAPGCTCAISKRLKEEYLENIRTRFLPHDWKMTLIAACLDGLYYYDICTTKYRIYSGNAIGLGHQTNYDTRLSIIERNSEEKKEMVEIAQKYYSKGSKELNYFYKIEWIFSKRKKAYLSHKILEEFELLPKTVGLCRLYESIVLDIFTIISSPRQQ